MGSFTRPSASLGDPLDCYLHGYVSSRIMNLSRASGGKGLPICIAASKVDGLGDLFITPCSDCCRWHLIVLTLTPNSHNYNYRSAVLFGYATLVEDVEEKIWAMELITNSVVPDRVSKMSHTYFSHFPTCPAENPGAHSGNPIAMITSLLIHIGKQRLTCGT